MKIGVFDSGYGGLTILEKIRHTLPEYDYIFLGDNARAPYGTRSFEVIYQYTWQGVQRLLEEGCTLVILACNTASAKALRTIQQHNLPPIREHEARNVLGVIRPTVEQVASMTLTGHIGVVATPGTILSGSYPIELHKQNPEITLTGKACPMWVPLIEAGEHRDPGADYFVNKYLNELMADDPLIDTLILGCTHYPLLLPKIEQALSERGVRIICQGDIVAQSLKDYLGRHNEYTKQLSRGGTCTYLTTESATKFAESATLFLGDKINATRIEL